MITSSKRNVTRQARILVSIVAFIWAAISSAEAQNHPVAVPQFEVAPAYSYVRANADNSNGGFSLNGASGSFTYNINDRFSAVADIGAYRFGSLPNGTDSTMYTYLFGPRFSLRNHDRFVPFAQALVGGGRLNASSSGINAGENGFAVALGGGVDLRFRSRFAIRMVEAEYLLTRFPSVSGASATQNNLRLSTGFILHFGSR